MRTLVLGLCLASGGIGLALADSAALTAPSAATAAATPPAAEVPAAATPAVAAIPATPAAAATPDATAAAADKAAAETAQKETSFEKHLVAEGYKVEMRGGEKLYCRTEDNMIGSRLGNHRICSNAEQLAYREHTSQEYTQQLQRLQVNPNGQ